MKQPLSELHKIGIINTLRSCQLFVGVPAPELAAIAEFTVARSLKRGAYLFHEGDPSVGFFVVQKGAVNVHRVNAAGKEQIIHVFRDGESFAEGTIASDDGYPADARAVEAGQVLLVQRTGMVELLRHRPELALRMLGSMSSHLRILVRQLDDLRLKNVETRLANWLLRHCPDPAGQAAVTFDLTMTKRVLAAELGTVSETLSRTLARFRKQKLVSVEGKSITIATPAELDALLRQCMCE